MVFDPSLVIPWIQANATTLLLLWPLFTGLLSLGYRFLDKDSRLHAFFEMCVRAGLDVPGALESAKRWLTKNAVPPVAMLVLVFSLTVTACASWWTPAHTSDVVTDVVDTGKVVLCIVEHSQEPPAQILKDCADSTPKLVDDTINTLSRRDAIGCAKLSAPAPKR